MAFYNLAIQEIYIRLKTHPEQGLSEEEAQRRLSHDGFNQLPTHKPNFWKVYLAPLFNWLIVIYLIGAAILLIAGKIQQEEDVSATLLYTTLSVVALNCIIAVIQQYRAIKKLKALEEISAPTAQVLRNGTRRAILAKKLVVGDIIYLEQGDRVPADCRVIRSNSLEVDESSLTGESESILKVTHILEASNIPLIEQTNIMFLGTHVTLGNGIAVVIRTGSFTEMGKISKGLEDINIREIPIQKKMNNFGKWLGIAVAIFWVVSFFIIWITTGRANVFKSLNSAMDIMPINIPLLSTIILITGVLTMASQGVIIRNLTSVDSLGRISILCADKTGTITTGKMIVEYVLTHSSLYKITGTGYNPFGTIAIQKKDNEFAPLTSIQTCLDLIQLLIAAKLGSNATLIKKTHIIQKKEYFHWDIIGNPTEGALISLFEKSPLSLSQQLEANENAFIAEFPFDSSIKIMSKLYNIGSEYVLFSKGAPEILIDRSTTVLHEDSFITFSPTMKKTCLQQIQIYADKGYRVLSIAQRRFDHEPETLERNSLERNFIYLGSVMILDLPRENVQESIHLCREAGIIVKILTGDSLHTANAIAKQIGLIQQENSGVDVSDGSMMKNLDTPVFARVVPMDKYRLVKEFQQQSRIVAMTGDGVNDALALSSADVGIAMGIRGTDVAKEAADMVIADDSFTSIVNGIAEGRGIFTRIRVIVFFYIAINVFEGLVQFILTIILDLPYFLDMDFYLQWIFLSITLHTIPGLILTFDITNLDVMHEKPRDSEEILSRHIVYLMLSYGILLAISMCIVYFLCIEEIYPLVSFNINSDKFPYFNDAIHLQIQGKTLTMLMVTLYFCESILIFQIRRMNKSIIKTLKEDSRFWMYILVGVLFSILISLMYIPNFQNSLANIQIGDITFNFRFMRLTIWDWFVCAGSSSICIIGFELVKYGFRQKEITF